MEITEEKRERVVDAISAGNYMETAAAYAGIAKDTLYAWLKRGARERARVEKNPRFSVRKEERPFVEFSDAVKKALAESEMQDVTTISTAAALGTWQAAAWRLERKFPDRWGNRARIEHTGRDGNAIRHEGTFEHEHRPNFSVFSDEELDDYIASHQKLLDATEREGGRAAAFPSLN